MNEESETKKRFLGGTETIESGGQKLSFYTLTNGFF